VITSVVLGAPSVFGFSVITSAILGAPSVIGFSVITEGSQTRDLSVAEFTVTRKARQDG
jgi:hypothetical protein